MARDRVVGAAPRVAEAVGDRQHRHVGRDAGRRRRGSGSSARRDSGASCTRKPRRRWLRVSAADLGAHALGGVQPGEDRRAPSGAEHVVAGEADAAVGSAPSASAAWRRRAAARRSAAPRRASSRRPAAPPAAPPIASRVLGAERLRRVALELDGAVEHLERVVEHVEVVVAALLDAAQRLELGQHDGAAAELEREPDPVRRRARSRAPAAARRRRARRRRRASPAAAARAAARASRVGARGRARRRAARGAARAAGRPRARRAPTSRRRPAREVGGAAERVDELAAGQRPRDRVDGEVAQAQGRPRSSPPRSGVRSACQRVIARDDAPGAELVRERERGRARGARQRAGRGRDVAVDRRGRGRRRRAPEQLVADGAADEPAAAARPAPRAPARARRHVASCAVAVVAARHPRADRAGDLVVDRALARGELLGADALVAVRAEQDRRRADGDAAVEAESTVRLSMLTVPDERRGGGRRSAPRRCWRARAGRRRRSRPGSPRARVACVATNVRP